MAEHLELVAEIPKVEKLTVQERLEYAKKRRAQQLKRWDRDEDTINGPPPPKKKPQRAKPVSFPQSTILLEAATRGDIEEVRALLEGGMDPDLANDDGLTGLHQACIDGCEEMINLMLEHGASLDAIDRELWTPLHAATACGNADIVELLIDEGANIVAINSDGNMPIDIVDEEDDELREILEAEMEEQGYTEEKLDELRELVEHQMLSDIKEAQANDFDIDKPVSEQQGATMLHIAVANGYEEVTEFLLELGASVDCKDKDGWEPIHGASVWGNEQVIQMLVEAGAELEAKTPTGDTPLTLCEDLELQQFIVDLKNKVKANKVKTGKRKRSNSRSLSVKRTSLKDKITISQNEAKAEAVLRVHPQLAFLIPTEEREKLAGAMKTEEAKPKDVIPTTTTGTPTQNSTTNSNARDQREQASDHLVSAKTPRARESDSPGSPSHVTDKEITTRIRDSPARDSPTRLRDKESPRRDRDSPRARDDSLARRKEKENIDPNKGEPKTPSRDPNRVEPKTLSRDSKTETTNIDSKKNEITKEDVRKPDKIDKSQSPTDQQKYRVPDNKTGNVISITQMKPPAEIRNPTVTPFKIVQKPSAQPAPKVSPQTESGGTSSLPRSTKSRHAPPPPLQHSSGSLSRSYEKSDTSGYPDSFSKRSRGSRENIVDVAAAGRLAARQDTDASVSDVKISAGTTANKANKPTDRSQPATGGPTGTGQRPVQGTGTGQRPAGTGTGQRPAGTGTGQRPAGTDTGQRPAGTGTGQRPAGTGTGQRPAGTGTGQRPAGTGTGQRPTNEAVRQDDNKNNASGVGNERIQVRDDLKVDSEKNKCCVLM